MNPLTVRLRIDFGPGRALGPGKIDLLEGIERTGSLSSAAAEMEMSYKRAWDLLQSLNELYGRPIVVLSKGGRGGGGAKLTKRGLAVISAFRSAERKCASVVDDAFAGIRPPTLPSKAAIPIRRLALSRTTRGRVVRD